MLRLAWILLGVSCLRLALSVSTGYHRAAARRATPIAENVAESAEEERVSSTRDGPSARRALASSNLNVQHSRISRDEEIDSRAPSREGSWTVDIRERKRLVPIDGIASGDENAWFFASSANQDGDEDDEDDGDESSTTVTADARGFEVGDPRRAASTLHEAESALGELAEGGSAAGDEAPTDPKSPAATAHSVISQDVVDAEEDKIMGVWEEYFAKYPIVQQYEDDWFSHAALEELTDQYWKTRDPVAFGRGLAGSSEFRGMFAKYASSSTMRELLKKIVRRMSLKAIREVATLLHRDGGLGAFAKTLDAQIQRGTGYSPLKHAVPEYGVDSIRKAQIKQPKLATPDWR